MDIDKLNEAISKMIKTSKGGVLSVGIYSSKDDLLIVGENTSDGATSVINNLFQIFFEKLKMFNFADTLEASVLVFEDQIFYTVSLNEELNITVILNPKKIELGFFKGILLKEFFKSI